MQINNAEYYKGAALLSDMPSDLPEIAISGKSNVGKSSFINCLCGRNQLARTSSTPGKTRLINFFRLNGRFYLVDLPGYGYAKVSASEQARWNRLTQNYLDRGTQLRHVIQLLDIRHAPTQDDRQMVEWLLSRKQSFTLVATKCDKLSRAQWKKQTDMLLRELALPVYFPILAWSSEKRTGREQMLDILDSVLDESLVREEN